MAQPVKESATKPDDLSSILGDLHDGRKKPLEKLSSGLYTTHTHEMNKNVKIRKTLDPQTLVKSVWISKLRPREDKLLKVIWWGKKKAGFQPRCFLKSVPFTTAYDTSFSHVFLPSCL